MPDSPCTMFISICSSDTHRKGGPCLVCISCGVGTHCEFYGWKKPFFNSLIFLVELYLEIDLLKTTHHRGHFLQLMSRASTAQRIQTRGTYTPSKGAKTSRVLEGKPEKLPQETGGRADRDVGIVGIVWRRQFLSWALDFMISEVSTSQGRLEQRTKAMGCRSQDPDQILSTSWRPWATSTATVQHHLARPPKWLGLRSASVSIPEVTVHWGHHFQFLKRQKV